MPAPKVDWERLKLEYVQGGDDVTHKTLAARYKLAEATVSRRASSERWSQARSEHRQEVARLTAQKTAETLADQRASNAVVREQGLHELVVEGFQRVRDAKPGFELQAAATALGILIDKLHRELDRPGSEAGKPGTVLNRLSVTVEQWVRGDLSTDELLGQLS